MKLLLRLVACLGVLVVFLAVVSSAFATSGLLTVTSDMTLTEDHHGNVWFAADSATLDCAGHSVIGPGVAGPVPLVGIAVFGRSHVTIRNCRVSGFVHGISLSAVDSFTLVGNTSTGNEKGGIALYAAAHGTVSGNSVSDNGFSGIGGNNLTDIQFTWNKSANNGNSGFLIGMPYPAGHVSTGIRLIGNVSSGNRQEGYAIYDYADGNTLIGNVAIGNGVNGFRISSSSNQLTGNVAYSNHWFGFVNVGGPSPFFPAALGGAVGNTYRNNIALKNNTDGVIGITDAADYNPPGVNTWKANWFGSKLGI
jgi:parallel beta-helix repeat protein